MIQPLSRSAASSEFSLSAARRIVHDLFVPRPWIYWLDFTLSYLVGCFFFTQVRGGSLLEVQAGLQWSPWKVFCFVASCLLFYRAAMFIHEVVHQRTAGRLRGFRLYWNLLCGIPFLVPSFVYYTHIDHHRRQHYGTERDGEYLPLEHRRPWYILFYLSWSLLIPPLAVVRFLILTPLAWLHPRIRTWIHQHASSMVMDPMYIRPLPPERTRRTIYLQEAGCFLWCLAVVVVAPLVVGRWPTPFLVQAYFTGVVIVLLNSLRTLGAHRWTNASGEMSLVDQLLDSVNCTRRGWLSELWGPVGTRYHALHHLFPSMPYHALPAAHRRLMRELPEDSPYRRTETASLTSALRDLWSRAATSN